MKALKDVFEIVSLSGVVILLAANLGSARAQINHIQDNQNRLERALEEHRSEINRLTAELSALRMEIARLRSEINGSRVPARDR